MALCNFGALMSIVFMEMVSVKLARDVGRCGLSGQAVDFTLGQALGRVEERIRACHSTVWWVGILAPFRGFPRCPRGGIGRRA